MTGDYPAGVRTTGSRNPDRLRYDAATVHAVLMRR